MARDARLFAPFDIGMDEHPKIIGLSDAAFRAFFEGVFYARRSLSDGFLDRRIVLRKWGQEVADELSTNDPDRPSWVAVDNGWQIRDFGNHHPLRADIEGKREQTSEAKAAAGRRSGEARRAKREAESNTPEQNANTTRTEPNRTRTNGNPETETETETETQQLTLLSPDESDDGTLIPDSWQPNQGHHDKATSLHLDAGKEAARFRDHANRKQRRLKNWNAGFTNWLKQQAVYAQQRTGRPSVASNSRGTQRDADLLAFMTGADNNYTQEIER